MVTTNKKRRRKQSQKRLTKTTLLFIAIGVVLYMANLLGSTDTPGISYDLSTSAGELGSVITPEGLPEQIINYRGMTVSFNSELHIPNWVAWELTGEEANGTLPRANKFLCDKTVPGCPNPQDYSNSGYDRGHMAPAGDMKWDSKAMEESFYLTNICPQTKTLNTGAWNRLEDKCRQWADIDSAIIIVCGPILTDTIDEYIGNSHVAVPKRFFKVILSPFVNPPRGIGFIMPNGKVPGGIQQAAVTIDEVEQITGFDFFSALPDDIETDVESQCKFHYWSTLKKEKNNDN